MKCFSKIKHKKLKIATVLVMGLVALLLLCSKPSVDTSRYEMVLNIQAKKEMSVQLFYADNREFSESQSATVEYDGSGIKEMAIPFVFGYDDYRLDFGMDSNEVLINKLSIKYKNKELESSTSIRLDDTNDIEKIDNDGDAVSLKTKSGDPYVFVDLDNDVIHEKALSVEKNSQQKKNMLFICAMVLVCAIVIKNMDELFEIINDIFWSKSLTVSLAENDFKTRFAGSYLGVVWAFVQPVITIIVYWFVFQVGFRSSPIGDFPYFLWLATGLVPWFFVSEAWNGGTVSLIEYSYLVKKVVFKISILPLVKIISAFFVHIFFICFVMILYIVCGHFPTLAWVQILYYSVCSFAMVMGLSYLSSAVMVFFRDTSQIIAVFLQVFVWLTPIMWSYTMLGTKYQWILNLNPMYYIVQGYRDALIDGKWFFENPYQTVGFWLFVIALLELGLLVFKRVKIHFADVL